MRAGKVGCFFLVCELSFHFNSPGDFFGSIGHSRERGQRQQNFSYFINIFVVDHKCICRKHFESARREEQPAL